MATHDFAKSAKDPDIQVTLFYAPKTKLVSSARNSMDKDSIVLAGYSGKIPFTNSYQVDPSAKKINKEAHILPVDELAGLVKAMTKYDPRGFSHQLELKETNLLGHEYYVSLANNGKVSGVILTSENVDQAINLIKRKESIQALVQNGKSHLLSSAPAGTDGPR